MVYNVFSGALNPAQSVHKSINQTASIKGATPLPLGVHWWIKKGLTPVEDFHFDFSSAL